MPIFMPYVGDFKMPNAIILRDAEGKEVVAVAVDEETEFTATHNDIRQGKTAVTESGYTEGTKFIPSYVTTEGYQLIPSGSEFSITTLADMDLFDFTKLQVIICPFTGSIAGSVAAEKIAINESVYATNSADIIATVEKDAANKLINLGFANDSGNLYLIRYFTYKEIY